MAEITMNDLQDQAKKMLKMMDECAAAAGDPEKMLAIAEKLQAEGKALEDLGDKYRQQELAKRRGGKGIVTVKLTKEQIKIIEQKTGVVMETVEIDDEAGAFNQTMPGRRDAEITRIALGIAEKQRQQLEAEKNMLAQFKQTEAEIHAAGMGELSEQLERLKADPKFLNGLLQKQKK